MEGHPWDDGRIDADEFKALLKSPEQKEAFFALPEHKQAAILDDSGGANEDIEETLDKLAKYLDSILFRNTALGKAAGYGLKADEADELARVWKARKRLRQHDS